VTVRIDLSRTRRCRRRAPLVIAIAVVLGLAAVPAFGLPGTTTRVSVDSAGNQATGRGERSRQAGIDADGRFTVFDSNAPAFVPGDGDDLVDVFVHDLETGATTLVSRDSSGRKGNEDSFNGALSADGRYVVFDSEATNLVSRDRNGEPDVFVHDRQTGATTRVSVSSTGQEADSSSLNFNPSISGDGRVVVFQSFADNLVAGDTNRATDVFAHDRATGTTTRVNVDSAGTQANRGSGLPVASADGRHVAFLSDASNLVANDTNGERDVFVHDLLTGSTSTAPGTKPSAIRGRPSSDRQSAATAGSSPSARWRPTWSTETPTAPSTSLSTTGRPARRAASASTAPARRATDSAPRPRSARTAVSSASNRGRATSLRVTPTGGVTSSSTTGRPA